MSTYKVLVPLDGSRVAEHSLVYLDALRSLGESQVLLLSVIDEEEDFRALSPVEAKARESNLLSTYLREVASDIEEHIGIEVETKVVSGAPASCILAETVNYAPNLLVISTHGRSGPSRWRLGSVADKVIRGAECNTLVVGPKATQKEAWLDARIMPAFQSILVPLDGSGLAESAIAVATSFAQAFGSTIHLVRVVPIPAVADGPGEASYMPDMLDILVDSAKAYLSNVVARISSSSAKVLTDVLIGSAASQLEDYGREQAIDLIVMTTHGRSGIARTALGSVTDRLLGEGNAPVLVVRARPTNGSLSPSK